MDASCYCIISYNRWSLKNYDAKLSGRGRGEYRNKIMMEAQWSKWCNGVGELDVLWLYKYNCEHTIVMYIEKGIERLIDRLIDR